MPDDKFAGFFDSASFALLGLSRRRRNFAWSIHKALSRAGKTIFAIHPEGGSFDGVRFYDSLKSLPEIPEAGVVCLDLKKNASLVSELKTCGLKKIWLQQGSYDSSMVSEMESAGLVCLTGCAMLYIPGASFPHRVHRFFHELFSKGRS